ncbi:MAG: IS3 family transposase [Gemmataceae bacterium]
MTALADQFPVRWLCRLLDCPRAALYRRPEEAGEEEERLRAAVLRLAGRWPTYGYRRITAPLRRERWAVNGKRVRRVMRDLGLAAEPPPRRVRTTDSNHAYPRYPDPVADLTVTHPNHVWVGDITYVRVRTEFVYLAVPLDVFTRRIRGWHLGRSLDQSLTRTALDRAFRRGTPAIHDSDQGVQHSATGYAARLVGRGVAVSMAAVGKPEENGFAERLMRTIREEEIALTEYADFADARRQLGRFLDAVYNRKRIHSALGYLTPAEFEQQWRAEKAGSPTVQ